VDVVESRTGGVAKGRSVRVVAAVVSGVSGGCASEVAVGRGVRVGAVVACGIGVSLGVIVAVAAGN